MLYTFNSQQIKVLVHANTHIHIHSHPTHTHTHTHNAAGKDDFLSDLSRGNGKRATDSDMLFTDQWAPATEIVQKEDTGR